MVRKTVNQEENLFDAALAHAKEQERKTTIVSQSEIETDGTTSEAPLCLGCLFEFTDKELAEAVSGPVDSLWHPWCREDFLNEANT